MRSNLKLTITIGIIFVFVGIGFLSYNFISERRELVFSNFNLDLSDDNITKSQTNEEETPKEDSTQETTEVDENYEYYIGKIEIPKINLTRGFYDKNSSLNNVNWNIKVLKESDYPNVNNGNLILAGHSGNYSNSYFANLYKLDKGDQAYIYYDNVKYIYEVVDIYNEDKDGNVKIKRNPNKTVLTLITCTKDDEEHQTIYILELVDKNNL